MELSVFELPSVHKGTNYAIAFASDSAASPASSQIDRCTDNIPVGDGRPWWKKQTRKIGGGERVYMLWQTALM